MADKRVNWVNKKIDPFDIHLDPHNPRIDVSEKAHQPEIRFQLLKTEKVIELAHGIIESGGLMPSDRIIVIQDGPQDKYIVIEGNRRTCATQLLLNHRIIPEEFKKSFPKSSDVDLLNQLSKIEAVVAPSRAEAEVIITKRHTEPGIEKWSPIAKQRRISRLLSTGISISEISDLFGMSQASILKTVREYNLFHYAKNAPGWKQWESDILNDPKLKINPFTRAFSLQGVKTRLGISFDANGDLNFDGDKRAFDSVITSIARGFLIPDPTGKRTSLNTRSTPDKIFGYAIGADKSKNKAFPPIDPNSGKVVPFQPKPPATQSTATVNTGVPATTAFGVTTESAKRNHFFNNLVNSIQDQYLIQIVDEIKKISTGPYPLAATFLLRALIERILNWCVDEYRLRGQLNKDWHLANPKTRKEPGLEFVLDFVIKNHDTIFSEPRMKAVLGQWKSIKEFSDLIIHVSWILPTPQNLDSLAKNSRTAIEKILDKSILK